MQIDLESIRKINKLSPEKFVEIFYRQGYEVGKITREKLDDLAILYMALYLGHTTPEEYYERGVKGSYIPVLDGESIKVMHS